MNINNTQIKITCSTLVSAKINMRISCYHNKCTLSSCFICYAVLGSRKRDKDPKLMSMRRTRTFTCNAAEIGKKVTPSSKGEILQKFRRGWKNLYLVNQRKLYEIQYQFNLYTKEIERPTSGEYTNLIKCSK